MLYNNQFKFQSSVWHALDMNLDAVISHSKAERWTAPQSAVNHETFVEITKFASLWWYWTHYKDTTYVPLFHSFIDLIFSKSSSGFDEFRVSSSCAFLMFCISWSPMRKSLGHGYVLEVCANRKGEWEAVTLFRPSYYMEGCLQEFEWISCKAENFLEIQSGKVRCKILSADFDFTVSQFESGGTTWTLKQEVYGDWRVIAITLTRKYSDKSHNHEIWAVHALPASFEKQSQIHSVRQNRA